MALSYLLGSVPTGLWLGLRLRNVDIREHGSKNIGATNTVRVLGKKLGVVALVCDMAKGFIPVSLMAWADVWQHAPLLCGIAAITGHTASMFLKFRGGKGVATSAGVFLGFCPVPTVMAAVVFAVVAGSSRMVSAGSIVAAVSFAVMIYLLPEDWITPYRVNNLWLLRSMATLVAVLILVRHRTNIKRIIAGNENKLW